MFTITIIQSAITHVKSSREALKFLTLISRIINNFSDFSSLTFGLSGKAELPADERWRRRRRRRHFRCCGSDSPPDRVRES